MKTWRDSGSWFGGAVLRPKTPAAEAYCKDNGSHFPSHDVYFVEGYGQFWGSSEPVPPDVEIVLESAEVPSLGGLSEAELSEIAVEVWELPAKQGEAKS